MRVIAGSARRMVLKSLDGTDTRPTLDRYKETLFNTIQTYVPDSFFIDVCAGTGAIGIEALSRGADRAVFIENNRKAISVIEENLQRTHLADRAEVLTADAVTEGPGGCHLHRSSLRQESGRADPEAPFRVEAGRRRYPDRSRGLQ